MSVSSSDDTDSLQIKQQPLHFTSWPGKQHRNNQLSSNQTFHRLTEDNLRNIGQMKSWRWWVDVVVTLWIRVLRAMHRWTRKVFRHPRVLHRQKCKHICLLFHGQLWAQMLPVVYTISVCYKITVCRPKLLNHIKTTSVDIHQAIPLEFEPVLFPVLDRAGPTLDRTGLGSFFGPSPVRSRRFWQVMYKEKFKLLFK